MLVRVRLSWRARLERVFVLLRHAFLSLTQAAELSALRKKQHQVMAFYNI